MQHKQLVTTELTWTHINHDVTWFSPELTINHKVGWFSPKVQIASRSLHHQSKSQPNNSKSQAWRALLLLVT